MAQPSGSLGFVPRAPRSAAAALPWSPRDISLDTVADTLGGLKGTWGVRCLWVSWMMSFWKCETVVVDIFEDFV